MPAIAALGPVVFDIVRSPLMSWDRQGETRYAEKPVLGARPPLEWVGEGGKSITLRIRLHPKKFGGIEAYEALEIARSAAVPLYFITFGGLPLGWVVIERLSDRHTYLGENGVGQVIEVDVSLRADGPPSDGAYFAVITGATIARNIVSGIGARLLA